MNSYIRYLLCVALWLQIGTVFAAPSFPALSGRVVDKAALLTPETAAQLTAQLQQFEREHGSQLVVATVPSLDGYVIAEYGYQLGRHWGIGAEETNNGTILLVAPNEKEVHIAVGYGLEGAIPDAIASSIIQQEVLPAFKDGNMEAGIMAGITSMMQAAKGEYAPKRFTSEDIAEIIRMIVIITFVALHIYALWRQAKHGKGSGGVYTLGNYGTRRGRGFSLGGGSFGRGGGFRGGGGSFGGGGASGRW